MAQLGQEARDIKALAGCDNCFECGGPPMPQEAIRRRIVMPHGNEVRK